jgi:hypothetical protein
MVGFTDKRKLFIFSNFEHTRRGRRGLTLIKGTRGVYTLDKRPFFWDL